MIDFRTLLLSIHPIADLDASSHCIKVLKPHTEWIRSAIPSGDGRLLLTCSDDHVGFSVPLTICTPLYSFLQTARITDIESAALKTEMRGHDNRIECAVFVPMLSILAIRELVALVTATFKLVKNC
jgi:platelet-activating factor acetylhydrolase IB subunit alpha